MRQLAMVVAAFLVLAMISPAFAQPFADTPTNHWAYDAIAELAAKGLIEGYPDGTFKGDRAMTRYEMAMVVARLLARIESIQIPTPQAVPQPCKSGVVSNPSLQASTQPQAQAQPAQAPAGPPCYVTRSDVDMILRLVNEFRAELAAKNVRLTAVEEELNAIKAKLDNVRITGNFRFRYDTSPSPRGGPLNGNPNTGTVNVDNSHMVFRAREGLKVNVDGSVSPNVHLILGVEVASDASSTPLTFNSGNFGQSAGINGANGPTYVFSNIADLFFDWRNIFGWPLELWVGRFGYGQQAFGGYPVQFGPFGLLLNTTSDTYGASTSGAANTGTHEIDGLRLAGHFPQAWDLQIQGLIWRVAGSTGSSTYELGEDAYGVDANVQVIPGLRIGAYYVGNTINTGGPITPGAPSQLYHVYGNPSKPSTNPVTTASAATPGCLLAGGPGTIGTPTTPGITCPAAGNGWGAYIGWGAWPGVHLDVEAAQWNDNVHGTNDSGAFATAVWDLGTLLGVGHKLTLGTGYEYLGANFYPPYGNDPDDFISGSLFPGNVQGFRGTLDFEIVPGLTLSGAYLTGNNVSNSMTATEWRGILRYRFAPGASVFFRYRTETLGGVTQESSYRLEMNYSF